MRWLDAGPLQAISFMLGLAGFAAAQHMRYELEDWQYFPSTATTTSVSEGTDGLYFSTLDGLLFADRFARQLDHLPEINMGLPSRRLYQVYVDASTEGLWVVHEQGVSFRLRTDETWRNVPFHALPDYFRGQAVRRVGGSFDGIWLDMDGVYTLLNSFTGEFMRRDIVPPPGPVEWNTSRANFFEPPDVLGWITSGPWTTGITEFNGPGFMTTVPTFVYNDHSDKVWYGTVLGTLFRGDPFTKRLESFQAGIAPQPVTTLYRDGDRTWFADNAFRRTGSRSTRRGTYFLSVWDERTSLWRYHSGLVSEAIRDIGVNDMLRVGRQLWLATMGGIVVLDTRNESWGFVGADAGLRDRAVWDLERYGDDVFAATARGVDRISPKTQRVIPEDSTSISPQTEVYTLYSTGGILYAGTASGVYAYTRGTGPHWRRISPLPAISISGSAGSLYLVANNLVHVRDRAGGDFTLHPIPLTGEARILEITAYGSYIWLATSSGAMLYSLNDKQLIKFGLRDGLPSEVVYAIEPAADWVWFLTQEGVVRFNWGAYFD